MNIIEQAEHELRLLMLCAPSTARALIDEVKRLRAELSTQETLVATLQEQKYAWDELLSENKRLRAELETANALVKRHEARAIRAEKLVFGEFLAYYASSGEVCPPYMLEEDGEDEPLIEDSTTGENAEECIRKFFAAIEAAMKEKA